MVADTGTTDTPSPCRGPQHSHPRKGFDLVLGGREDGETWRRGGGGVCPCSTVQDPATQVSWLGGLSLTCCSWIACSRTLVSHPALGLGFSLHMRHSRVLRVVTCHRALTWLQREAERVAHLWRCGEGTALPRAPQWEWSARGLKGLLLWTGTRPPQSGCPVKGGSGKSLLCTPASLAQPLPTGWLPGSRDPAQRSVLQQRGLVDVTGPPLMLLEAFPPISRVSVSRDSCSSSCRPCLRGLMAPQDVLTDIPLQPHGSLFRQDSRAAVPTQDQTLGDLLISGHEETAAKSPAPTFPPLSLHRTPSEKQAFWVQD